MTELDVRPTAAAAAGPPRSDWRSTLAPLVLDLGLPIAAYYVSRDALGTSMITAFIASSVVSVVRMAWTAIRERRVNGMSVLVLVVNLVSIALSFGTGSVRLVAGKDAAISSIVGLGMLVSAFRGRPVLADGMRPFVTKGSAAREAAWTRLEQSSPAFRRYVKAHSAIYGGAFILDCVVRVVCAAVAPVSVLGWMSVACLVGALVIGTIVVGGLAVAPAEKMVDAETRGEDAALVRGTGD